MLWSLKWPSQCVFGRVPASSSPSSSSSSSFSSCLLCPPPLLGLRVLVYHVLTWGGVPVSGCARWWPRPFFFVFVFFFFFLVLVLSFVLSFVPPSSWGACAGLPRPDLGWCHSLAVRALLATSLSSSSSSPSSSSSSFSSFLLCPRPLLGVRVLVYHVLTWVESQCWGMRCWPRPFVFFLFFFFVPPSVALLFLGCVCWYTTS